MARTVTCIPQTKNRFASAAGKSVSRRRVAAYARVSTDSDEQATSYEAQVDYFTQFIQARPDWVFVGVYTDEGITGTSTKHREGFKQMVADALDGKIDLIVTKSVSRFARNTVDSLTTVRQLKERGVEVYFQKENIYTFDGKGELLITIMSSLAQEESRSISENVTWGQRKRFADGKVSMPYKNFLGYEKGPNGIPVINEEQAEVVRLIFKLFIEGKTPSGICTELTARRIPTPGKKTVWSQSTIQSILSNEKYKGDALLQKRFTVDFLTKTVKKNEGEVPSYYVEDSHPAIISPEEFDLVQAELERRKLIGRRYSAKHSFSSKLVCADCGGFYGRKIWHSNDSSRHDVWQCNDKFKKQENRCQTPVLSGENIQRMYAQACGIIIAQRPEILETCQTIIEELLDTSAIDQKIQKESEHLTRTEELILLIVREHASIAQTDEEYHRKCDPLMEERDQIEVLLQSLTNKKTESQQKLQRIRGFLNAFAAAPADASEWNESSWRILLDKAVVNRDGSICFNFINGTTVSIEP